MISVKDYFDIYKILMKTVMNEDYGHSSYVSDENSITEILKLINTYTKAKPDLIEFNNGEENLYVLELYNEDNNLTYAICPACDDDGIFYTNYGLCLVDENVPESFESDYSNYGSHDDDYLDPIRVHIGKQNKIVSNLNIDKNKDGTLSGFTRTWKNDNVSYSFTYHSTNEKDVLDMLENIE